MILLIFLTFIFLSCGEDVVQVSSFEKTYTGYYTIERDDQSQIGTAFSSLDDESEITDVFIFKADDGLITVENGADGGFFDMICLDKSGKTTLSGTVSDGNFSVEALTENKTGILCTFIGKGTFTDGKVDANFTVEIDGGDYDGNIIEIDFHGDEVGL